MRGESDALTHVSVPAFGDETRFPVRGRLGSGEARRENRARGSCTSSAVREARATRGDLILSGRGLGRGRRWLRQA